ncbi:hypothetical protein BC827DRAFT_715979 [Russula dissimulans]|nr:hypothetical protein BC827DRAFT_715979 [Russula dissimulans]
MQTLLNHFTQPFSWGGGKLAGAKIRGQQRNGTPRRGPRHVFGCGPGARGIIPLTSHATACDLALEFSRDDQVSGSGETYCTKPNRKGM